MGWQRKRSARVSCLPEPDWTLLALAQESARALAGEAGVALRELALTGGSPQGVRPKALVHYDAASGHVSTRPGALGTPWLVKFPAQGEHKEVCAIEQLYAELARDCGLEMPASALFDLSPAEIDRLHGPVGLNLGAKTPAEIAVSIAAEIVSVKNGVAYP